MKKNAKNYAQHILVLGENEKKKNVFIQADNRLKHLLIVGTKGTGKSTGVLPALAKQDIEDKKAGATVVVGDKETALLLYALAKRAGRDVVIIKPSITDSGKLLLGKRLYDYQSIKTDVIDFEKAILKKQIVIVDMEFVRYHEKAIKGVAYILTALQEALVKENEVTVTRHFLYVDDAHLYLPYLKSLLYAGKDYGLGCTLFLESRHLLVKAEERAMTDSMIRNTVLMSGLTVEDAQYYTDDVYEKQLSYMRNRPFEEFVYSTTDKDGRRTTGNAKFNFLSDELLQSLRLAVPRYRGGIAREQVGVDSSPKEQVATPKAEAITGRASVKTPIEKSVSPERDRVTQRVDKLSKRHVVILDNLFDEDDEF